MCDFVSFLGTHKNFVGLIVLWASESRDSYFTICKMITAVTLTDLDFADDICLLSDEINEAQELLEKVESECLKVGLHLNDKKTKYMSYNIPEHQPLKT